LETLDFLDNLSGILVLAEDYEFRVPQMIRTRPSEEIDLGDQPRACPDTVFHFFCRQAPPQRPVAEAALS
jgi:hypothetical protein